MRLELYQMETCPYCQKVRSKLSNMGVSYVTHNPRKDEDAMNRMLDLGGKDQVPFMVVKDDEGNIAETMYESDDINEWLDANM